MRLLHYHITNLNKKYARYYGAWVYATAFVLACAFSFVCGTRLALKEMEVRVEAPPREDDASKATRSIKPQALTRCTPAQAQAIADQEPIANSNCPNKDRWIHALTRASFNRDSATLVWIGCNKGDDLLHYMREWSQNTSYDTARLGAYWDHMDARRACPMEQAQAIDRARIRPVNGFCIEPITSTVQILRQASREQGWASNLHVIHAAVSSVSGIARVPVSAPGVESAGIGTPASHLEDVPMITMDELAHERGIDSVDMLAIDTEGNDMRVVLGGLGLLPKVRYLEFEYHKENHWAFSSLEDLLDLLDKYGFTCFWAANSGGLWRLTGCWHDSYYPKRFWSNVACASRDQAPELLLAMEAVQMGPVI